MNSSSVSLFEPFTCRIESIKTLTEADKVFRLKRLDGQPFGHRPGQFMQVSIVGYGEAPISVSSSPTHGDYLELGVRRMGSLTGRLHEMKVGDELGLRGPFGTYFPTDQLTGKDVVLVAGGCGLAPLRALIQYIEDRRSQFGNISILYGAKSPEDIMYKEEVEQWQQSNDIDFQITVDNVSEKTQSCWVGNTGLITKLVPPLNLNPNNTVAVICGPPIMYRFVIEELHKKSITNEQIIVSLERHMKCGVGKCGHCTIEHLYCCIDGPVFQYGQVEKIRGAI